MQFSKIAVVASLAALASAQSITDLPSCALNAGLSAIASSGCAATDYACLCKNQAFINTLTTQVQSACSAADIEKTIQVSTALCAANGVTLSNLAPAPTSSAVAASSAASSSAAAVVSTTTAVSTSTSSSVVATTTSSVPASSTPATTAVVQGTGNVVSNKTITTGSATSSAFTGAAAVATAMSGPLAAGGVFGLAALLLAL